MHDNVNRRSARWPARSALHRLFFSLLLIALAFVAAVAIAPAAATPPRQPAALAGTASPAEAEPPPEAVEVATDSPRASVKRYLDLSRAGRHAEAARYLDVPPRTDAAELSRQLAAVLDRRL